MKSFEKISLSRKLTNTTTNETVFIYKFKKVGTERVFFAPEINGKRINNTMYARLYDATTLGKNFLKRNQN